MEAALKALSISACVFSVLVEQATDRGEFIPVRTRSAATKTVCLLNADFFSMLIPSFIAYSTGKGGVGQSGGRSRGEIRPPRA